MADMAKLLIDGQWTRASDGGAAVGINPATGGTVGEYAVGSLDDVDAAIAAAKQAFKISSWAHAPRVRAEVLLEFANRLDANKDRIVKAMSAENGKLHREAAHEVAVSVSELRYYAGLARNIFGKVAELEPGLYSMLTMEPLGVAAVIVPWNAPITLLVRSVAPAIAAGCTMIIKPADQTAIVNSMVFELLDDIDAIPDGVINVVTGPVPVSERLVQSEDVDVISYTGSTHVGKLIMEAGAKTLKRMNLELGGSAPCVILPDADKAATIAGISRACFAHAGQVCMAASRVYVPRSRLDEFQDGFSDSFRDIQLGFADDTEAQMGPVIDKASRDRVLDIVATSSDTADVLVQGGPLDGVYENGAFLTPSLLHVTDKGSPMLTQEIFGPAMSLIAYDEEGEAIDGANDTRYGLCASVWTKDHGAGQRVAARIDAGTVWLNHHMRTHAEIEVGGYKESGIGRLHGVQGLNEFLHTKNISWMQ